MCTLEAGDNIELIWWNVSCITCKGKTYGMFYAIIQPEHVYRLFIYIYKWSISSASLVATNKINLYIQAKFSCSTIGKYKYAAFRRTYNWRKDKCSNTHARKHAHTRIYFWNVVIVNAEHTLKYTSYANK